MQRAADHLPVLGLVKKLQVARSGLNKIKKLPQILRWYLKPIATAMDRNLNALGIALNQKSEIKLQQISCCVNLIQQNQTVILPYG